MSKIFNLSGAERKPSGYRVVARGSDRAEIYLYGVIGQDWYGDGVSAKQFAEDLRKVKDAKTIDLRINSEGGDVFAGKAMYTLLQDHKAKIIVHVDGLAASAASFVAMAGDEINVSEGAFIMIHNAWTIAMGGVEDFRRTADLLEVVNGTIRSVYMARTKRTEKEVRGWMDAETWFTGPEALENGFADKMTANVKVAASVRDPGRFKNTPSSLYPRRAAALAALAAMKR